MKVKIACKILTIILFAQASIFAQSANLKDVREFEVWLDDFIAKNFPTDKSGQLAFVLVKDDKIFFQKGYGFVDAERKIPVSPDKTFFTRLRSANFLPQRRLCNSPKRAKSTWTRTSISISKIFKLHRIFRNF